MLVNIEKELSISSHPKDYTVYFTNQKKIQDKILELGRKTFLVVDSNVNKLYANYLENLGTVQILQLEANENLKTFKGIEKVCEWLLNSGAKKDSILIGVGGGVIQDICTFVAHIYYRGIDWIYIPTTLLSQSDSCIGAKCGINFGNYKNQLGVIHAPSAVFIDTLFLKSLNSSEVYSGLGEMLKLSLTGPNQFYDFFVDSLINSKIDFETLIYKSLLSKKPIIEEDEFESDLRRILNYGHSFGHALEYVFKGEVPHGLAVVWGIDVINYIGKVLGITPKDLAENIRINSKSIFKYSLPNHPDLDNIFDALSRDKKIKNNKINFAFLESKGNLIIKSSRIDVELKTIVSEYLKNKYVFRPS